MRTTKGRVALAINGSLESVAALGLLINQGYDVLCVATSISISNISQNTFGTCLNDKELIKSITNFFKVDLEFIDISQLYQSTVIDNMLHEVLKTRSPFACASCNSEILFKYVMEKSIIHHKADLFATWHYARSLPVPSLGGHNSEEHTLYEATDTVADETYELFMVDGKILKNVLFPIGDILAKNVVELCKKFEFPPKLLSSVNMKKCHEIWLGHGSTHEFIKKLASDKYTKTGLILNTKGDVMDHHSGHYKFQVGDVYTQPRIEEVFYVVEKNYITGNIIVGAKEQLLRKRFRISHVHWLHHPPKTMKTMIYDVKIGHKHKKSKAKVTFYEDARADVSFEKAQLLIQPGHYAVFYDGLEVIGGGFIENVL